MQEQVVAVTGKANPKTPNDLVVEEIPIDCKKSYKIIDEYLQILKRQRKKEGLVKLLKEQVTAFTDDLLSNKPQDDLTKETSTSKMIFENLCLTGMLSHNMSYFNLSNGKVETSLPGAA